MVTKNEITGDSIKSKGPSKTYSDNWEAIFGKKKKDEKKDQDKKEVQRP